MKLNVDMDYFRSIQGTRGCQSPQEDLLVSTKNRLTEELKSSINYVYNTTRNNVKQPLLIIPHGKPNRCIVEALPNDDLYVGDMIIYNNKHWLVTEINVFDAVQKSGVMWLCNYYLKWQNNDSVICEQWAVVEDNTSINTKTGNTDIQYLNQPSKIYLQYNNKTKYIHIDKRLAIGTIYDQNENQILNVYQITGYHQVHSGTDDSHSILLLDIKNGQYNDTSDNLDKGICDYVEPVEFSSNSTLISGRDKVRVGSKNTYTYPLLNNNQADLIWKLDVDDERIKLIPTGNTCELHLEDIEELSGLEIILSCADINNQLETGYKKIKVV